MSQIPNSVLWDIWQYTSLFSSFCVWELPKVSRVVDWLNQLLCGLCLGLFSSCGSIWCVTWSTRAVKCFISVRFAFHLSHMKMSRVPMRWVLFSTPSRAATANSSSSAPKSQKAPPLNWILRLGTTLPFSLTLSPSPSKCQKTNHSPAHPRLMCVISNSQRKALTRPLHPLQSLHSRWMKPLVPPTTRPSLNDSQKTSRIIIKKARVFFFSHSYQEDPPFSCPRERDGNRSSIFWSPNTFQITSYWSVTLLCP